MALLAMHALATLYAGLFMLLLHQSGMELGLPWHGIMSTWTCAATTLWRWLRSAWFTCIRLLVVVTVLEGCHLPLEASTWPSWWATMHHVWEAVLLGSMHLMLAFCFLLNA